MTTKKKDKSIDQTCTSTDPTDHQGNTCPVHEMVTHTHTEPDWVNQHTGWEVPQDTRKTIERYLEYGIDPGGFFPALFSDKLLDTVQSADDTNVKSLVDWALFVFWEMPFEVVGSKEKVQAHIEKGGYRCQEQGEER